MFYDNYLNLCRKKGVSPSRAAQEAGLNRSAVMKWKEGGKLSGKTMEKLTDYFEVSLDVLLGTGTSIVCANAVPLPQNDPFLLLYSAVRPYLTEEDISDVTGYLRVKTAARRAEAKELCGAPSESMTCDARPVCGKQNVRHDG